MSTMTTPTAARGGSWLLDETEASAVFTPEKISDEHRLMAQTTDEFVENEVLPQLEALESKNWDLARSLVRRCGELGLLGINVPEQYGGVELDKVSSLIVSEHIARAASFGATFGAQANLCILPIFLFGTPEQKTKYLPKLLTGELVGAYALSESGSGSDALGAKARATKQLDGSWVLNGEKMWITNGGFADVIIVFAKVDGEKFTAFIVERTFPGFKPGNEEHKMGIHGSSTTPIFLENCKVPKENLLHEIGRGHIVAFNILNAGRFTLGASCVGGSKHVLVSSSKYAKERKAFGKRIGDFGLMKEKLAEMAIQIFAVESMVYRSAVNIEAMMSASGRQSCPLYESS